MNESLLPNKLFQDQKEFSQYIETLAFEKQIEYHIALIQFCDENDFDIEDVAKLISRSLKEKIEQEFIKQGYLKKQNTQKLED